VATQLGDFTDTASNESQRAADIVRQTQATMILEMQQALEAATQRFNETAEAMRATAKEVGSELESTRTELSRGVLELPEETRASAAAMRRVVAEQIEALAELNAIVRAQPATHDLNDRRAAPPPPRREEPAPRPEPVRQEAPRAPEPVREAPRVAEIQRPEPMRAPIQPVLTPRPQPAPRPAPAPAATIAPRPVTPAPRPAAPPTEAKPAGEEGGGWLRDVLRNASAPAAAPAAPAPAPQPGLTSLTDEIARAMEHAALGEAWRRYQAGEQAVFSRRIYTLSGQGTYDDVRKRIQRDADFATTAATYMSEFEHLLQQAAAAPNPAQAALDYLLSDRGKVYTMLAHASGRLG
jgi:hypothetical protein